MLMNTAWSYAISKEYSLALGATLLPDHGVFAPLQRHCLVVGLLENCRVVLFA
jgi:hypothetical protein